MKNTDEIILVPSVVYTKEGKFSVERTKAELEISDPEPEKATAVLNGEDKKDESKGD